MVTSVHSRQGVTVGVRENKDEGEAVDDGLFDNDGAREDEGNDDGLFDNDGTRESEGIDVGSFEASAQQLSFSYDFPAS